MGDITLEQVCAGSDKRSKKKVVNSKVFFTHCRKDPHRGMGWVNAYEPINKGKLGYAQSWKYQKERK